MRLEGTLSAWSSVPCVLMKSMRQSWLREYSILTTVQRMGERTEQCEPIWDLGPPMWLSLPFPLAMVLGWGQTRLEER